MTVMSKGKLREFYRVFNGLPTTPLTGDARIRAQNRFRQMGSGSDEERGIFSDDQKLATLSSYTANIVYSSEDLGSFRKAQGSNKFVICEEIGLVAIDENKKILAPSAAELLEAKVVAVIGVVKSKDQTRGIGFAVRYQSNDFNFSPVEAWHYRA